MKASVLELALHDRMAEFRRAVDWGLSKGLLRKPVVFPALEKKGRSNITATGLTIRPGAIVGEIK